MAGLHKFHSFTMAQGAVAQNFHVESLDRDPLVTAPGRFWHSAITGQVMFSYIDGNGALKKTPINDKASFDLAVEVLTQSVTDEVARAQAAEGKLTTDLAAEVTRAKAAEVSEHDRATTAEAALEAAIATLTASVTSSNSGFADVLAAETARAKAAEGGLDARLSTVESTFATTASVDQKIAALGTVFNYIGVVDGGAAEATAVQLNNLPQINPGDYYKVSADGFFKHGAEAPFHANKGDGLLFNKVGGVDKIDNTDFDVIGTADFVAVSGSQEVGFTVDLSPTFKARFNIAEAGVVAEAERALAAEQANAAAIAAEATRATQAETKLTADLASEVTRAKGAEATELARAQAAESELQSQINSFGGAANQSIGDLANLKTAAKNNLVASVNEVYDTVQSEIVNAQTAVGDQATALQAEIQRAQSAEGQLQTVVAAETSRAQIAEAAEVTRAKAAEADLAGLVATEANRAQDAEQALAASVVTETTRATQAEDALSQRITDVTNGYATIASVDQKISALGNVFDYVGLVTLGATEAAAFDVSTLERKAAGDYYKVAATGGYFKVGPASIVQHANAGDGLLFNTDGNIDILDNTDYAMLGTDDFVAVTGSKDIGYTVDLAIAFKGRVAALESGLTAEAARATTAEQANAAAVAAETSRARDAETALQISINNLAVAAGTGTEALRTELNSGRKTWRSASAALVHDAVHGFNSDEFTYSVMVQGDDGVFRNDVVPVEDKDNNTVTVTLSESRNIRVTFQSTAQL